MVVMKVSMKELSLKRVFKYFLVSSIDYNDSDAHDKTVVKTDKGINFFKQRTDWVSLHTIIICHLCFT